MATIVHLSDLHLRDPSAEQSDMHEALVATLKARHATPVALLAITGDVFDTASDNFDVTIPRFVDLFDRIRASLGGEIPTVIVPGNHDRRRVGVVFPHRAAPFEQLRAVLEKRANVRVYGTRTPFLSDVVPAALHGLPAHLVAYDTTYLPRGIFSAGGALEREDLLRIHSELPRDEAERPLVVLMHHHLVPTPLTDVEQVDAAHKQPAWVRFLVKYVVGGLVSNADHEELTMTALGAGTALSTLQSMRRAVIVMHGHKHYPTARLLRATFARDGDLLLASAGCVGKSETWTPSRDPNPESVARLRPSFNEIAIEADLVRVVMVQFPRTAREGKARERELVRARREGALWHVVQVERLAREAWPLFARNDATFVLDDASPPRRYHARCTRHVEPTSAWDGRGYVEWIDGPPGSAVVAENEKPRRIPCDVAIPLGRDYAIEYLRAFCSTTDEGARAYGGPPAAYECVELVNRWSSESSRLVLRASKEIAASAFGSVTDMAIGREEPTRVDYDGDRTATLALLPCPRKTRLRIYWPLA
jgi:3',5'-cyclic AMP phosphodiesterase CpdA